jgi:hypothetical protein
MNLFIHFRNKFFYELVLFFVMSFTINKKRYELYYILLYTIIVHRIPRLKKKNVGSIVTQFSESTKNIFRLIKRQMETELAHTECFLLPDGIFGLWISISILPY